MKWRFKVYCAKLATDFSKMAGGKPRNERSGETGFETNM
jgi:hypothetical protein